MEYIIFAIIIIIVMSINEELVSGCLGIIIGLLILLLTVKLVKYFWYW